MDACPYCGSIDTVWRGYRYNFKSKKRLKKCSVCKRKFTPNDGFLKMRFSKEDILKAVQLYRDGMTLSDVKRILEKDYIKVSRWTILKWYKKYKSMK